MGANTKQLRTRIKSVDSTLHLTKAMGLVASSKMRRAMEATIELLLKSQPLWNASRPVARLFGIVAEKTFEGLI